MVLMLANHGSVQVSMESSGEIIMESVKKRSQEAKRGRIKYTLQLLKEMHRDLEEVKLMQRTICAGLKGLFNFKKPMIEEKACADEVDREILSCLYEAGSAGLLPKDLVARLGGYNVSRHKVSRRIVRMNKRLLQEVGESVAEKRGWHWALTGFAFKVWNEEEEESD